MVSRVFIVRLKYIDDKMAEIKGKDGDETELTELVYILYTRVMMIKMMSFFIKL